jgi:hypothetical protein
MLLKKKAKDKRIGLKNKSIKYELNELNKPKQNKLKSLKLKETKRNYLI